MVDRPSPPDHLVGGYAISVDEKGPGNHKRHWARTYNVTLAESMRSGPDIRVQQRPKATESKRPRAIVPFVVPIDPKQFPTGRGKTPHRPPCVDRRTQDTKRSPRPGGGFRRNTQNAEKTHEEMAGWTVEHRSNGRSRARNRGRRSARIENQNIL